MALRESQRGPPGYVLRVDLNKFLQAPVYEERHGMDLSVLSALARLNLDPWEQAAALASLSREAAALQLISLLSALPDWTAPGHDEKLIIARLVSLLPGRPARASDARVAVEPPEAVDHGSKFLWIYALVMLLLLSVQWLNARSHVEPPAPISQASAEPVLPTVPPK